MKHDLDSKKLTIGQRSWTLFVQWVFISRSPCRMWTKWMVSIGLECHDFYVRECESESSWSTVSTYTKCTSINLKLWFWNILSYCVYVCTRIDSITIQYADFPNIWQFIYTWRIHMNNRIYTKLYIVRAVQFRVQYMLEACFFFFVLEVWPTIVCLTDWLHLENIPWPRLPRIFARRLRSSFSSPWIARFGHPPGHTARTLYMLDSRLNFVLHGSESTHTYLRRIRATTCAKSSKLFVIR